MSESAFLTEDEVWTLTSKKWHALQVKELVRLGIPHWVNASGRPVVARSAIDGTRTQAQNEEEWIPGPLRGKKAHNKLKLAS